MDLHVHLVDIKIYFLNKKSMDFDFLTSTQSWKVIRLLMIWFKYIYTTYMTDIHVNYLLLSYLNNGYHEKLGSASMATFACSCEQWDAIESTTHYPYKVIPSSLISLMMWVQSQLTMGGT